MGYMGDAIKGVTWIGFSRAVIRAFSVVRAAIIARILSPSNVGVFGITTIVLSLTEILTETGVNIFLIQQHENIDEYIDSAWVVSIIRGFLIGAVIFISAPFVAGFYNSSEAESLLRLVSIVPLLRGFINPSVVKFTKDLRFNTEFIYRSSQFLVESIVSIVLVVIFKNTASLVWGLIAGAVYELCFTFVTARPIPRFVFHRQYLKEIRQSGKWLTATGIFNYLYHNGDNLVVGKMLGTGPLGFYDMAYKFSMLPITEVSDVYTKVTFPVFVKIAGDRSRLRRAFLRSVGVVALLVIPAGVILAVFSEPIVTIILGAKWVGMIPALRVLSIFGAIRAIAMSAVSPVYALKKQEMITVITFVSLFGLAVTIVPFIQWWGLPGAGASALTGTLLCLPFVFAYLRKLLWKE